MDILALVSNPLVQTIGGSLFGLFAGGVGVWMWIQSGFSKAVKEGGPEFANKVGLFVYNMALKNIKDTNLREQITKDLDAAGDNFDKGWDLGIRGEKI